MERKHCSYDINCIVVSYRLRDTDTDDINIGLFSLENGTLLHKFDETYLFEQFIYFSLIEIKILFFFLELKIYLIFGQ